MLTLWNTYSFFVTYANLDKWTPDSSVIPQFSDLDRWLLSSLEALVRDVTKAYETYDVIGATRPIEAFVDNLSNWYLRPFEKTFLEERIGCRQGCRLRNLVSSFGDCQQAVGAFHAFYGRDTLPKPGEVF